MSEMTVIVTLFCCYGNKIIFNDRKHTEMFTVLGEDCRQKYSVSKIAKKTITVHLGM